MLSTRFYEHVSYTRYSGTKHVRQLTRYFRPTLHKNTPLFKYVHWTAQHEINQSCRFKDRKIVVQWWFTKVIIIGNKNQQSYVLPVRTKNPDSSLDSWTNVFSLVPHTNGSDLIRILKMSTRRTRLAINIAIGVSPPSLEKKFENHCLPPNANEIECKYFLVVPLASLGLIYIRGGLRTGLKAKRSLRVQKHLKYLQFKVRQWIKCRERDDTCFIQRYTVFTLLLKKIFTVLGKGLARDRIIEYSCADQTSN